MRLVYSGEQDRVGLWGRVMGSHGRVLSRRGTGSDLGERAQGNRTAVLQGQGRLVGGRKPAGGAHQGKGIAGRGNSRCKAQELQGTCVAGEP